MVTWKSILLVIASVFLPFYKDSVRFAVKSADPANSLPQAKEISLFLSGDVMIGRGVDQILPNSVAPRIYEPYVKDARDYISIAERKSGDIPRQVSYDYIWGDALKVWEEAAPDLKIINLETSITTHDEHWPEKMIQYRMHPDNVKVLTAAGINFSSLANNHVLDWQRPGLMETMNVLHNAGISYAGAGENLNEARKPSILKTKRGNVIVFAYGSETSGIPEAWAATSNRSGVNLLPDLSKETISMIRDQVKRVKREGDVVVFSVHWGSNWGYDIPPHRREFARQLIEQAGVDVVHGHSSHHPLGIEVYNDKLIIYGAGDFINDYEGISGHEMFRDDLSLMYFPVLDAGTGKLKAMKMVPMQISKFRLNYASDEDTRWLAKTLNRESQKFGTKVKLEEDGTLSLAW
ncbi:CapA family protein [Pontibacter locisalis]|uniref:CapA family protein n=1 Tax=Pontibacter locisalis TaxID=1719035 RepID=A0ABW5IGG7_9BACT